jgi:hypothetical protein
MLTLRGVPPRGDRGMIFLTSGFWLLTSDFSRYPWRASCQAAFRVAKVPAVSASRLR